MIYRRIYRKVHELGGSLKTKEKSSKSLIIKHYRGFLFSSRWQKIAVSRDQRKLPYFTIGHKTYYRASDIRAFVRERTDYQTYKQFEKANQLENKL